MASRKFYLLGFAILITLDTSTQICFKMAATHAQPFAMNMEWLHRVLGNPWVYGAILGYLGTFFTWMTLLRRAPVGPAFAASHMELVGVLIISVPLFGEAISLAQILGATLILAGVACLAANEAPEAGAQH
jgi:drug/metabolite transporter (DMT)-like permease